MQLIEYLLWKHKVICDQYNINISTVGSILNHSQPIVLYGLIKYFRKNKNTIIIPSKKENILSYIVGSIKFCSYNKLIVSNNKSSSENLFL